MIRHAIATLLAAAVLGAVGAGDVAVARAEALAEPPSSLDPQAPHAKLTFKHSHRKVSSCYLHGEAPKSVCRSKKEDASAAATLVLTPVADAADVPRKDKPREPITVTLDDQKGRSQKIVEVPAGRWDLDWKGSGKLEHLLVTDHEDFTVTLRTVTGECKKDGERCVLTADKVELKCVTPEAHRPKN